MIVIEQVWGLYWEILGKFFLWQCKDRTPAFLSIDLQKEKIAQPILFNRLSVKCEHAKVENLFKSAKSAFLFYLWKFTKKFHQTWLS